MHVVMTGATGFIGKALCAHLRAQGDDISVLTRTPGSAKRRLGRSVMVFERWSDAPLHADAVINLGGESMVGQRWTLRGKDSLRASRLALTHGLAGWLPRMQVRPEVLINASAVGYYGADAARTFDDLNESDASDSPVPATDFGAQMCRDWELAAREAETTGLRVCRVRLGVVLGANGGALQRMLPAFKWGLGARLGDGQQWFSWVHLDDVLAIFTLLLRNPHYRGAFNACAPVPIRQGEFADALAGAVNSRVRLRLPSNVMHLMMGEAASMLMQGQRVVPARLQQAGYQFQYPEITPALASLLRHRQ